MTEEWQEKSTGLNSTGKPCRSQPIQDPRNPGEMWKARSRSEEKRRANTKASEVTRRMWFPQLREVTPVALGVFSSSFFPPSFVVSCTCKFQYCSLWCMNFINHKYLAIREPKQNQGGGGVGQFPSGVAAGKMKVSHLCGRFGKIWIHAAKLYKNEKSASHFKIILLKKMFIGEILQ